MGFLLFGRGLYDLKLPLVPKERMSALSYQFAHVWRQGGGRGVRLKAVSSQISKG